MKSRILITIALASFSYVAIPVPADAQEKHRVNNRMQSTYGSCAACDLSNKDLTRFNLKNADFSGSNFTRSNLSGGRLTDSNLKGADFDRAYLVRLRGHQVDFSDTSFSDATLTEATLSNSILTKTDMRRADLSRGAFFDSDFTDADFTGAIAPDAQFKGSRFIEAQFDNINLSNAFLDGGNFTKAKFGDAILLGASLKEANLTGADLSHAQGLSQDQLDLACGDAYTRLPFGLSIPYCESALSAETLYRHAENSAVDPKLEKAAKRLDRAIADIEGLMRDTPKAESKTRRRLQGIHSDLVSSRRAIGH